MEAWSRFRVQDSWTSPFSIYSTSSSPKLPITLPTTDTRLIPLAIAALCFTTQIVQLGIRFWKCRKTRSGEDTVAGDVVVATGTLSRWQRSKNHVKWYGGGVIYGYLVARVVGCIALLIVSGLTLRECRPASESVWSLSGYISECPEVLLTLTFVYTTFLSVLGVVSKSWSVSSARYTNTILLSVFALYLYRDIWPLATFFLEPQDIDEGWRMWAKFGLVVFTAVFIPLFIPRKYSPVDPANPLVEPNPEQTASIISRATYSFLDPLIALGYRVSHLSHDQIPPLADYDCAEYQTKIGFPYMDVFYGSKRRHLFWGLLTHFRWDYVVLGITVVIYAFTTFSAPIGINQLLRYIETQGQGATIRPWFWIAWLFVGPIAQSFSFQYYLFVATRTLVRIEILVTQLVFEHSLRIRLKAEAAGDDDEDKGNGKNKALSSGQTSETTTAATTPDNRSVVGSVGDGDEAEAEGESVGSTVVSRQMSSGTDVSEGTAVGAPKKDKKNGSGKEEEKKEEKDTENVIGKINNLVSTDVGNITDGRDFLLLALYVPLQIILCMAFLYRVLGWSAFIGLAVMVALFPLPGYVAKKLQEVQSQKMKKTDARIQAVTEAVNVLRMVKLFGWEVKMSQRLRKKRDEELELLWKYKLLDISNGLLSYLIPTLTMLVTFTAYTMVFKQELRASVIFPSMSVFSLLREQMQRIFWETSMIIQAKVSLDRVNEFLFQSELLDSYLKQVSSTPEVEITSVEQSLVEEKIGFNNATFVWSLDEEEEDGVLTPSRRTFKLRVEGELLFLRNKINLIIGPTGAGKTSILMALLGEMHFVKNYPDAWFNLPRKGGVAYASQESWVQNETIKNNILFGAEYDEERYKKVIKQCALERDLELFEAGDKTEVGERGLTLSGGQKARVTLARAIYSSAEVILLDDVLAALDVHTAAWIVDHCFRSDLVKGRTVLLVTHNVALASPVAENIVTIGIDGSLTSRANDLKAALSSDKKLASEAQKDAEIVANADSEIPSIESQPPAAQGTSKAPDGKLMVAEEIVEGHVTWKSIKLLFTGLGGAHPVLFFVTCVAGLAITDWCSTFQTWFLGYWAAQYETRHGSEVDSGYYLTIYSAILAGAFFVYSSTYFFFTYGALRASRTINNSLIDSVFGSTLRWLDETPTGRIIARCTQDMRAVDGPVPQMFVWCLETTLSMVTKLAVIVMFSPIFLFPGLGVAGVGFYLGNMYLKAQLSVKREMSNARSPMLAHFSAAIHGLVSIRAYGAEKAFKAESLKRINHYARIARTSYNLNRWIGARIDGLGAMFTAGLASYLVYGRKISASNTGFSLAMAVEFSLFILWVVRLYNEFEVQANSLERIQGYLDIEHEPKATESGKPPAAWPTSGDLRVEKLVARYSATGPKVLHEISFNVKSGERVGVVGRTGSGKSSLTLALLRCILTEGTVYYDGIATNTINLDALRSSITIIPQIPELLSGTLRQNLDPFSQNDDATLNDALRSAGLFSLQEDAGEARLSLDSKIAGGGANLSVGQRQILALARAMVRGSKLLILDEATSAIDYKTDAIIQTTLRRELPKDVSVITIAHRLQTIMDADKVLVLDEGRIVEFDSPRNLLRKESGTLKDLVEGSGEKEVLYGLAEGRSVL